LEQIFTQGNDTTLQHTTWAELKNYLKEKILDMNISVDFNTTNKVTQNIPKHVYKLIYSVWMTHYKEKYFE
jgi:hypothetical protein